MSERLMHKLRDWYIVLAGVAILIGLFAVATLNIPGQETPQQIASSETQPAGASAPAEPTDNAPAQPGQETTAQSSPPAERAAAPSGPAEQQAASGSRPAASGAAPAHDHTMAQDPAGQGQPPQPQAPPPADPEQQPAAAEQQVPQSPEGQQPPAQPQSAAAPAGAGAPAGDATAGRQEFRKCQACHSLDPGKHLIGPSLAGVFGRAAAQAEGFNYSPAMKESGVTWDAQNLDAFLQGPQKFIPKNKMAFPGLRHANERTNLIAYLASTSAPQPATAQQDAAPAAGQPAAPQQSAPGDATAQAPAGAASPGTAARPAQPAATQPGTGTGDSVAYIPDVRVTLRSGIAEGRMVYLGVGGTIDGVVNPVLSAAEGQVVQITLLNGEGAEHDIVFPDQNAASPRITGRGTSTVLVFRATAAGDYVYYCSVAGHREAGMEGQFLVTPRPPDDVVVEADISQQPTEVPPAIGGREPQQIRVDLLAVELEARLAEGTTYGFWTFNGRVPGPMLRARVGDTLDVHVTNSEDSSYIHSVDFHAATGPGGGAAATQVDPGHTKSFKFKALVPGLYVYHCATPMVAHHIANGMYGLILIEPEGGLPPVDREFYVMQGEVYTDAPFGQHGRQEFSVEKLLREEPEYFVFNGSVGALSKLHPMKANVGETVRIYFGVGGPNHTSSFHVIGEIFDRVYSFADLQSPPLQGVQTITVPAGGAAVVEFKLDVPGNYILVDHALSRAERGLVGILQVEGQENPEIFDGEVEEGSGH